MCGRCGGSGCWVGVIGFGGLRMCVCVCVCVWVCSREVLRVCGCELVGYAVCDMCLLLCVSKPLSRLQMTACAIWS